MLAGLTSEEEQELVERAPDGSLIEHLRAVDRETLTPQADCVVSSASRTIGDERAIADAASMGIPLLLVVDECGPDLLPGVHAVVDAIVRPYGTGELEMRLIRLASQARARARVEERGIVIDHDAHEVVLPAGAVHLTPREYAVIARLAKDFRRVVSRSMLVAACAVMGSSIDLRGVDVIVTKLRRKLGEAAAHLETVRGLGYRLV